MSWQMYDWLLERADCPRSLQDVLLGLQWSIAELAGGGLGLCFSPSDTPRTLPWPGTLRGRSARELCGWVRSFDDSQACVGAATINAAINGPDNAALARSLAVSGNAPSHLRVFEHFAARLGGAKVVVVGRYPGLDRVLAGLDYLCLERRAGPDCMPDLAAEYVLPEADWVFLTASAIANKSLPRLLELSQGASVVLMGPSLPWLAEWADFGVDYLAGVAVRDALELRRVAAEGGGTRIFELGVEYRVLRVS